MKTIFYILALPYLIIQSRYTHNFDWSKVNRKYKRPLKWWFYKALCEYHYWRSRNQGDVKKYYYYLDKCCKAGFNLYGEPI